MAGRRGKAPPVYARLALLLMLLWSPSIFAQAGVKAVVLVVLNTEVKGEHFVLMTEEGDVLFPAGDLKEIGVQGAPGGTSVLEEGYVSLKSLSPGITFSVDNLASTLVLTVDPGLLRKQVIDLGRRGNPGGVPLRETTGFLNYSIGYGRGDDPDSSSIAVPLETGVRIGRYLGFSSFSCTRDETDGQFVRMSTNITRDDPDGLMRSILGDFTAFSGILGGGGSFGGISISRYFALSPYFVRAPGLGVGGILQTPSEVDVYVNDVLVRKEKLPPGEFTFENLPVSSGAGTTSLVIRDAFGRTETIGIPFYLSSALLKPGVHDFSYNIGFERRELGEKSFDYGGPAFAAFHRVGFSESFTGGLRAEAERDLLNAGITATFLVGRAGEVDTAVAFSSTRGSSGLGSYLSYAYTGGWLSGRFSIRAQSREYANLSLEADSDKSKFEGLVGLGVYLKSVGTLSATYSSAKRYLEPDSQRFSLQYSRRLFRNVSFTASYSRSRDDETGNDLLVGLSMPLGKESFGSVGYQNTDGAQTATVDLRKSLPRGPGLGYALRAERRENGTEEPATQGSATFDYNAAHGVYTAGYSRVAEENQYDLRFAGALVYVDGSVSASRPVTDGFALVKVADLEGVRVYASNQEVGVTNKRGRILVPSLVSYLDNKISLEPEDIPVNYGIPELEKYVAPPYRGGGLVAFDVAKLQGFTGFLYLVEKGEKKPAEYAGLDLTVNGKKWEGIVGKKGEFYVENVPPGRYPARVFLGDRECRFTFTVPGSDKAMVDVGEILCEMD